MSWIYISHGPNDTGARHPGWWWHNESFYAKPVDDDLELHIEVGNAGFGDASSVMVDWFWFDINRKIQQSRKAYFSIPSGTLAKADLKFSPHDSATDDSVTLIARLDPLFVVRASDLMSPGPSAIEIRACMELFKLNRRDEGLQILSRWKEIPGIFVYPCCALFIGTPQN
ncbi:MAG: hypothetical protein Q8K29_17435 [Polaromonas sp.]|nr:hypothetical protein [Polaromonas sp.]